jgi:hypothetical protein
MRGFTGGYGVTAEKTKKSAFFRRVNDKIMRVDSIN